MVSWNKRVQNRNELIEEREFVRQMTKGWVYKFFASVIILFLMLLSSCIILKPATENVEISLYVSEYNSGPAVDDANVELIKDGRVVDTKRTSDGKVRFSVKLYSGPYLLRISKNGHAKTTIKILNIHSPLVLNTTLRKTKLLPSEQNQNEMNILFDIYTSKNKVSKLLFDGNSIYNIFGLSYIYISAQSTTSNFPVSFMYAKLGNPPGAEYLASPRLFAESNVLEGELDLTPFSGKVYLFIDAYDVNDNRYEVVVPLTVTKLTDLKVNPYVVEADQPAVFAYNLNTTTKYYSTQDSSMPNQSKSSTNLYVKLSWKRWSESMQKSKTDEPDGYVIYKSYDGIKYEKLTVVSSKQDTYYDTSDIKPGSRVWYAIASKYGGIEGPKVFLGSVEPLPMIEITDVSPLDGATNVSLSPTFSWKISGVEKYEGKIKYLYDIWIYDLTVNSGIFHYPIVDVPYFTSDSSIVTINMSSYAWKDLPDAKLQPGKPYEWAPELIAVMWNDNENNSLSLSVNCDYNFKISPVVIAPEKYYLFVTGNK
ncbi:carboxypeptidase regulatory-like domain-containing protein [Fervidobacterium pennivorans]|uniref:carboxypeptidase regulatory-like domain-containing protein n=1 Tax=Fervidobacterium pennivorans TaxID=93466 RepID=UPI00059E363D|nr:carboxypeptidase regulatory-like domain-containing protein [Fervidobacterium pennivorans]